MITQEGAGPESDRARSHREINLFDGMLLVHSLTTEIFMCGKIAAFLRGRRRESVPLHCLAIRSGEVGGGGVGDGETVPLLTWSALTFYCVWP